MRKADVLEHFGTTIAVSERMTAAGYPLTRTAVSNWRDIVPEMTARRIAEVTGGAVPLRAEDYKR